MSDTRLMLEEVHHKSHQGKYYIGLMSGTSADGIDIALVEFISEGEQTVSVKVRSHFYQAYSDDIVQKITSLYNPADNEIDRAFSLDIELAKLFSKAIAAFLAQESLSSEDIIAIGSHGQTIRHRPNTDQAFTLQIGCCQTLATLTNIKVIGQFRRKDMVLGGQGAPLVPAFHQQVFSESNIDVFVVNMGGMANISYLPQEKSKSVIGFDTGPGNALLDDWFQLHHKKNKRKYDQSGHWAKSGTVEKALLTHCLADDYFKQTYPKSTGREYFNHKWLEQKLASVDAAGFNTLSSENVQATLAMLTAETISRAIKQLSGKAKVYLCGGGVHNKVLLSFLNQSLNTGGERGDYPLMLTNANGIAAELVEAVAFAWLAFAFEKKIHSNLPAVTGARNECTLGVAYYP